MADRLVHLQLHLLGVDHDRRHAGRARVGAQQRGRLLGDARRLALEPERLDVLPAGLRARAAVRARIAADLRDARRATAKASIPPPHSTSSCSIEAPSEETNTLCSRWARTDAVVTFTSSCSQRRLGAQAELDLVGERDRERVASRPACGTRPCAASTGASARWCPPGAAFANAVACAAAASRALGVEPPVAGEAPGAVDEHAHADALALGVVEPLDAPVAGSDHLRAPDDHPRVRVGRPGAESRGHRLLAKLSHDQYLSGSP